MTMTRRTTLVGMMAALLAVFGCSKRQDSKPEPPTQASRSGITVEQEIRVGTKVVVDGPSPSTQYSVVFEDDGDTGYLYGLDTAKKDNPILDALHIYNVKSVSDRSIPSTVQIVWSADGLKAALLINKYPHAIFDFQAQRGYCRTGFPPPAKTWSAQGHEWDDKAQGLFR